MRLLLTGAKGFTGVHFAAMARGAGYDVYSLDSDLTDAAGVAAEVAKVEPTYVVHLAGISAVTHADQLDFYQVNLFGTQNLLQALADLPRRPTKVLLASTANVYGNQAGGNISESVCPKPVNHYAISKLAMEHMAATFFDRLPIVIARPFNYTGVGHDQRFVIPKIVDHFKRRAGTLELGSLDVYREYNDVRMVCDVYLRLLASGNAKDIFNVCTGKPYSLHDVLEMAESITGHKIEVVINPDFVRANELRCLAGDASKLRATIGDIDDYAMSETLNWMLAD